MVKYERNGGSCSRSSPGDNAALDHSLMRLILKRIHSSAVGKCVGTSCQEQSLNKHKTTLELSLPGTFLHRLDDDGWKGSLGWVSPLSPLSMLPPAPGFSLHLLHALKISEASNVLVCGSRHIVRIWFCEDRCQCSLIIKLPEEENPKLPVKINRRAYFVLRRL